MIFEVHGASKYSVLIHINKRCRPCPPRGDEAATVVAVMNSRRRKRVLTKE